MNATTISSGLEHHTKTEMGLAVKLHPAHPKTNKLVSLTQSYNFCLLFFFTVQYILVWSILWTKYFTANSKYITLEAVAWAEERIKWISHQWTNYVWRSNSSSGCLWWYIQQSTKILACWLVILYSSHSWCTHWKNTHYAEHI